jgi:hypothetical protein
MRIATWLGGRKAGPTVARSAIAASVIRGARHFSRAAFGASSEAGTSSSADVRFAPSIRSFDQTRRDPESCRLFGSPSMAASRQIAEDFNFASVEARCIWLLPSVKMENISEVGSQAV